MECDAGDAAENFVHVKDLFCDRFSIADQQCTGRSAQGVKLSACGGWPAAFLADFGKVCAYPGKNISAASSVVSARKPTE